MENIIKMIRLTQKEIVSCYAMLNLDHIWSLNEKVFLLTKIKVLNNKLVVLQEEREEIQEKLEFGNIW